MDISIHAPRVGSDLAPLPSSPQSDISIHAPRVGSDYLLPQWPHPQPHFNPRSPCGERPAVERLQLLARAFQSTLPVWGATPDFRAIVTTVQISIHAPRVGSDFILHVESS